ncbi:murein biosynthesis integral membrane protein MurJ [Phycicoccus sp. CSK15P-2]|uniref:murein biosynthesis integral membrane protein MurJ n=1 Tax=Phycicoccus sp. CSK15P-2 TaxID=2807627 RepID=UPI00194F9DDF|nr:lipid II flippase MurJ [Phycicoccus sp. CSK15P-2]MBM6403486.1 murein biosynthesis integral membrane protein MurJ [Phycicoccus sp. CSK15P-2]
MSAPAQSVGRSGAVMAAGTLSSRLAGMLRALLLTSVIGGTGLAAEAFTVANTLPNSLYLLLAGGTLNAVLVPQIIRARTRPDAGEDFVNRLITAAIALFAVAAVVLTALSPLLVRLYFDTTDAGALKLATVFAFICVPQVLFYGLYTIFGQVLNANGRFAAFTWAPLAANLVAIGGLLWFLAEDLPVRVDPGAWTPRMVLILAGTATISIAVQAAALVVPLRRMGFRYRPRWGLRGHGFEAVSDVAKWSFGSIVVVQVGYWVTTKVLTNAASRADDAGIQGAAGIAAFNPAQLLLMLPHGIVTVSLVTALYTQLSEAASRDDHASVMRHHEQGLRMPAPLLLPVAALVLATVPLVTATFFFENPLTDTEAIASVLVGLFGGVVPLGWVYLNDRVFYAQQQTFWSFRTQCVVTGLSMTVAAFAATLPPQRTATVLAFGQTFAYVVGAAVGWAVLRRQHGHIGLRGAGSVYLRVGVPAVVTAVVLGLVIRALFPDFGVERGIGTFVTGVLVLGTAGVVEVAVTWGVAHLLGVEEVGRLLGPVLRRVRGLRRA